MAIVLESAASARIAGSPGVTTITVDKPSGTVAGDYLVAVHFKDQDSPVADMTAPAGWTQAGEDYAPPIGIGHAKVWVRVADGGEGSTFTFGTGGGSDATIAVHRISGAHPTTPLNIAPTWSNGGGTQATSHIAPTISPTATDCLLLCGFLALTSGSNATYTPPAGMTERSDLPSTGGPWIVTSTASQVLVASGATGTRTAACSTLSYWLSMSMAVAPAVDSPAANTSSFFVFF